MLKNAKELLQKATPTLYFLVACQTGRLSLHFHQEPYATLAEYIHSVIFCADIL